MVNDVDHIDYDGNSDHSYKYRLHPNVVLNQSEISSMVRSQTNIDNLGLQHNITISTTTSSHVSAGSTDTFYVSFLTTEGNNILVDQELFTGIEKNQTKTKTFSLPELRDNIQVKLYTTNIDGIELSEVKITSGKALNLVDEATKDDFLPEESIEETNVEDDKKESESQENAEVTNEASANEETEVKSDVSEEEPKEEKAEESEKGET